MRLTVTLAAVTLSMMSSLGCTRTRTVTRFVPVVQSVERCKVTAPPLPPLPVRSTCPTVEGGEVLDACYSPGEAWRLAAFLEVLVDVWTDVKACESAPNLTTVPEVTP